MKANRLAIIGVLFGLAGAVLLALFIANSSGGTSEELQAVFVAGDDGIQAGTDAAELASLAELREFPEDVVPERALSSAEDVTGQRVSRPIGPGEILTVDQFAAIGPASGGVVVPDGWEAVSVEARPAPGVQGYVTPGSLVNLYVTATTPDETNPDGTTVGGQSFTQLVMAHTEVLAVTRGTLTGESTEVSGEAATGSLVFLLKVRPEDVPTLVFSEQNGSLWFSLANDDDPSPVAARFTFDNLDPDAITQSINEARTQLENDRVEEQAGADALASEEAQESGEEVAQ